MLHIIILRAGRAERAGIRSRHCRDSALRRRCRARGRARAQRKGKRSAVRSPPFTDALRACLSALRDACTSPSRRFVRTVAVLFCSRYTSAIRVEIFVVFFFRIFFYLPSESVFTARLVRVFGHRSLSDRSPPENHSSVSINLHMA